MKQICSNLSSVAFILECSREIGRLVGDLGEPPAICSVCLQRGAAGANGSAFNYDGSQ